MTVDVEQWRGLAPDTDAERTEAEAPDAKATIRLRASSRALLGSLLRPHRRLLILMVLLLLLQNAAAMAGPYLVMLGIGKGIAPLAHGDASVLTTIGVLFVVAAAAEYAGKRGFLWLSGRIGQAVLLDLRQRVYRHFQRLSIGFHERYTSGRMVARLTSDMDTISELVDGGIDDLVLAALSVISIAGILLFLDPALALVALLSFPFLLLAVELVPARLGPRLPPDPGGGRAGDRPLRRVARRDPRGPGVSPRTPQPTDLRGRQQRVPGREPGRLPADRDLRTHHQGDRQRHRGGGADVRRLPRPQRRHGGRDPGRVPALPAPVLRADAGTEPVLQRAAVGHGRAGETVRGAAGTARGAGAGHAHAAVARGQPGRGQLRARDVRLPARPHHPAGVGPAHSGRPDGGTGRRHRSRQVDRGQTGVPVLRPGVRRDAPGRNGPAGAVRRRP